MLETGKQFNNSELAVLRDRAFAIAYRMLGSISPAEDIAQETLIRFDKYTDEHDVQSSEALITTIATRLSLNVLRDLRRSRESYYGSWLPEPLSTARTPDPDSQYNAISYAFLTLLEQLNPIERAVLILRQMFDYSFDEIAEILDKSPDNCRKILSRARQHIKSGKPRYQVEPTLHRELLGRFIELVMSGDMEQLAGILCEDIVLYSDGGGKAPATAEPLYGREVVTRFAMGSPKLLPEETVADIELVNGMPALVFRLEDKINLIILIDIEDGKIAKFFAISNPDKL